MCKTLWGPWAEGSFYWKDGTIAGRRGRAREGQAFQGQALTHTQGQADLLGLFPIEVGTKEEKAVSQDQLWLHTNIQNENPLEKTPYRIFLMPWPNFTMNHIFKHQLPWFF